MSTPTGGGLSDFVASNIRTGVPILVGGIVGWLATIGIAVDDSLRNLLVGAVAFVAGFLWYIIVRALERKWPSIGWLLGYPGQPIYSTPADPAVITGTPAPVVPDK